MSGGRLGSRHPTGRTIRIDVSHPDVVTVTTDAIVGGAGTIGRHLAPRLLGDRGAVDRRHLPPLIVLPPSRGRPLRDGALCCPAADHHGTETFAQWVASTS